MDERECKVANCYATCIYQSISRNGALARSLTSIRLYCLWSNVSINGSHLMMETNSGKYLQAEVDGGFGRDVLEFLVKGDTVTYRAMATKVVYIYPFTTAFGNSKGQEERMNKIVEHLGWYSPSLDLSDDSE